jgi:hypothetical protein
MKKRTVTLITGGWKKQNADAEAGPFQSDICVMEGFYFVLNVKNAVVMFPGSGQKTRLSGNGTV